jgi:hypothetical protein
MSEATEPSREPAKTSKADEDVSPAMKLYVVEQVSEARKHSLLVFGAIALVLSLATGLGAFQSARSYINDRINNGYLKSLEQQAAIALRNANSHAAAAAAAHKEAETQRNLVQIEVNKFMAIVDIRIKLNARKESLIESLSRAKTELADGNKIAEHWRTDEVRARIANAKKRIGEIEAELDQLKQQGIE